MRLTDSHSLSDPESRMMRWVERVVVGERLCPFAQPSIARGGFEVKVSEATDLESAYHALLAYLADFVQPASAHLDSGLLVFSDALSDFDEYLDCLAAGEEALEHLELSGVIQLASFHPQYLFEGSPPEDHAHWTNRAPLPAFHLLRESAVSDAVDLVRDPDKIPERNIAHLRQLSADELRALFADL